jgi:putative DNA methylase
MRRKLIETAMPLDVVSRNASREKSIRHGHPSTLHLWWSRKPLAAARAVLFAQLVDDPGSRPDLFPTLELQDAERARLLDLVGRMSAWGATVDTQLMHQVRKEVAAACGQDDVVIWDPFAGGGSIPLEGQRLAVPVVSSDLNPVAVLLQRALLELPRRWCGRQPVARASTRLLPPEKSEGLAADLRAFGDQVLAAAREHLRPLYPPVHWSGADHEVAAYLWVRTVECGNPACGATVPMLSNPWLRRKKGQEAWLEPRWDGHALQFRVVEGTAAVARAGRGAVFTCVACGTPTTADDVKGHARERGLGRALRCVVPDSGPRRPFLVVPESDVSPPIAQPARDDVELDLDLDPLVSNAPTYGVFTLGALHLPRQRAALDAFADAVRSITPLVREAALSAGWNGVDAAEYARDVTILLGLVLGRLSNRMSTACIWNAHLGLVEQTFIQNNAIAYPWDFAEANPLSRASGSWPSQLDWVARVLERCDPAADADVVLHDARTPPAALRGRSVVVSTDPPYFDYFLYSSLSDYFYVWLRRALREVSPELFATIGTPRHAEIVMRAGGDGASRESFLEGLTTSMACIGATASTDYPITIYYAYKSTEGTGGGVSAWEAFLGSLKAAGLVVTATWPIRTERTEGIKTGTNSLASSIVVVCRQRPEQAPRADRRRFLAHLREQVPVAVARLQEAGISPVDLAQAAIGPGMAVFTSYADILDADGASMPVGVALDLVNQVIGEALSHQEGDLDAESRFCLAWFEQYGFAQGPYGVADGLAKAKNASVAGLERSGVLRAVAGSVRLLAPADLPAGYRVETDRRTPTWEVVLHVARALHEVGAEAAAALMAAAAARVDLHAGKELAYLLYSICEHKGWTQPAALFNGLGTSWNDLEALTRSATVNRPVGPRSAGRGLLSFDDEPAG